MHKLIDIYYEHGFSIIPAYYKTKVPAVKGWTKYTKELPEYDQLKKWFDNKRLNINIILGELSNVCVIDFDSLESTVKYSDLFNIDTFTVKTNRGYHKYFKYPKGYKLINVSKHEQYQDIDFKMNNTLITAAPSTHESGAEYTIIAGFSDNKIKLADLPDNIIELCLFKPKSIIINNHYEYNPCHHNVKQIPIESIAFELGLEPGANKDFYYCYNGHDDRSASLKLYRETNSFYCFGCKEGGDSINLWGNIKKYGYKKSLLAIAKRYGISYTNY